MKEDSKTGLLPFMLALAEGVDDDDDVFCDDDDKFSPLPSKSCLSSGFEMLRMRPDLLIIAKSPVLENDGGVVMKK